MKERPILFNGPMVRAILEGRKTVTRRIAKPVKHPDLGNIYSPGALVHEGEPQHVLERACPHGRPGDRLWVRETWAHVGTGDPGHLVYRATYPRCLPPGLENVPADIRDEGYRWRPSIHMPRSACRILLEITAVRVERLQDISQEQARAEGVRNHPDIESGRVEGCILTPKALFECLWCDTYGDESWFANPWVWVVEFRRVTP